MEKKYWDQNGERNDLLMKFENISPNRGNFEGDISSLNKVLETQSVYYGFFNDGLCNHISIDEDGDVSHNYRNVDIKLYKEIENIIESECISEENIIDSEEIEKAVEYALTRALEEQEELINEVYNNKTFVIEGFPRIKNITKTETAEELGIYNVTLQMCNLEPGEELSLEIKKPEELQRLIFSDYYREVLTVETKGDQIISYTQGILTKEEKIKNIISKHALIFENGDYENGNYTTADLNNDDINININAKDNIVTFNKEYSKLDKNNQHLYEDLENIPMQVEAKEKEKQEEYER